ncbi:MAG: MurR/RpiR family transcriptional regulator [Lachnospiraceae bacterium]|nr:MurR/RpiR family transcriptional regulator [Lachnospiraceae bacterium]
MADQDLFTKINENFRKMSKGQKSLVRLLNDDLNSAAFMTASRMGKAAGVSESTVVRFAMSLGFEGYPEFQEALQGIVKGKLTSVSRMSAKYGQSRQSEIITSVFHSDIEKINDSIEILDPRAFESAVEILLSSRRIYCIGLRSCAPLAHFLAFYLNMIFDDVRLIESTSASEIFEQLLRVGKNDCVVGISFPRYSMRTLKAMEYANEKSAKLIAITDNENSPLTMYSSCNLLVRSDQVSIVDSLVAPLSLINALIVALSMRRQDAVLKDLTELEHIWADYQIYGNDEINLVNEETIANYPEMHFREKHG